MKVSLTEKKDGKARLNSLRNQKLFDGDRVRPYENELIISLNLTSPGRVRKSWTLLDYMIDHISERKYKLHWGALVGSQKFENKINSDKLEMLHSECQKRLKSKELITWLDLAYLVMLLSVFQAGSELSQWAEVNLNLLEQYSNEINSAMNTIK
jgi:hypothetical protein